MIYTLLPVHNRRQTTARFIQCLKKQTYKHYHLVLIDDGCTDGTAEMVRSEIKALTVIKGKGDWWWGGALQQGFLWLKSQKVDPSELVLLINDDTEFEIGFLERARAILDGKTKTLLFAQNIGRQTFRPMLGFRTDWRRLRIETVTNSGRVDCFSTRGLFMRVEDFFTIGGFHPHLLPHYGSDTEFTLRARRKGMNLVTDPSLRLYFDEETSGSESLPSASLTDFLRIYFSKKSRHNPLMWTMFIALACPWKWKLINWGRVWTGMVVHIWRHLTARRQGGDQA